MHLNLNLFKLRILKPSFRVPKGFYSLSDSGRNSLLEHSFPEKVSHNDIYRSCNEAQGNSEDKEEKSEELYHSLGQKGAARRDVSAVWRKQVNISQNSTNYEANYRNETQQEGQYCDLIELFVLIA